MKMMSRDCDKYDAELLIKIYPWLERRCEEIDNSILRLGVSYSNNLYNSFNLYDEILNEMEEKSKIINLKLIIDETLKKLKIKSYKTAMFLIHYSELTNYELMVILDVSERNVFRRRETLFLTMASILNDSEYKKKVVSFIDEHGWTRSVLEHIKQRGEGYDRKTTKEIE